MLPVPSRRVRELRKPQLRRCVVLQCSVAVSQLMLLRDTIDRLVTARLRWVVS